METIPPGAIVVGVTGPGEEQGALRFAAACAERDHAEVVLVHAYEATHSAPPPSVLLTYAPVEDVAKRVVTAVGEEFEDITRGAVEFRTLVVEGAPAAALVDLSHQARMVVVQHRRTSALGRLFVGSTARGAAAHASCPVVSVNADWTPADPPGDVVVGLDEEGMPPEVAEAGYAWAAATGAPVRIVHAWRLDPAYDDLIPVGAVPEWRKGQKEVLASAVARLTERHPEVPQALEVRHHWPADVLVDDSQVASLVVVGRHRSHRWGPRRLGSIAGTVLREARSPVMVVPVGAAADVPRAD